MHLLRRGVPWDWTDEQQKSFEDFEERLQEGTDCVIVPSTRVAMGAGH